MEIDIANNIKAVELLKVEVMQNLTDLFGDISAEPDADNRERIINDAAGVIGQTYLLCNRLGISSNEIDEQLKRLLRHSINEKHILERRYGDLSSLLENLRDRKDYYEED